MAVKTRRKYPLDEEAFKDLNRDSAYWIGYLYGDGNCSCENKVRLSCAFVDRELLYSFRDFIHCIHKPVKEFLTKTGHHAVRFEVRSWKMLKSLSRYELNKVKKDRGHLHPDLVQDSIAADFVRGIFDADGTFYYDGLHRNHLFAEITGYLPVLKSLKQILESAGVITDKKHITRNGSIFRIRFPKDSCLKLIRYMYKGSPRYYLRRKYGIAKDYLDRLNEKDLQKESDSRMKMYFRPVSHYNKGKQSEYNERTWFVEPKEGDSQDE